MFRYQRTRFKAERAVTVFRCQRTRFKVERAVTKR